MIKNSLIMYQKNFFFLFSYAYENVKLLMWKLIYTQILGDDTQKMSFLDIEVESLRVEKTTLRCEILFCVGGKWILAVFVSSLSRDGKLEAFILAKRAHLSLSVYCCICKR
jgi:hypothetical protein